jgi:hypothetical protein
MLELRLLRLLGARGATVCGLGIRTSAGWFVEGLDDCLISQGHTFGSIDDLAISAPRQGRAGHPVRLLRLTMSHGIDDAQEVEHDRTTTLVLACAVTTDGRPRCTRPRIVAFRMQIHDVKTGSSLGTYAFGLGVAHGDEIIISGVVPTPFGGAAQHVPRRLLERALWSPGRYRVVIR